MNDLQLILDIWDAVRDNVTVTKRPDVANGIMKAFAEYGFEARDIGDIVEEDDDLAEAYNDIFLDDDDDDDDEYEDDEL